MHLPTKQSDFITDLAVKCRGLTDILLEDITAISSSLTLTPNHSPSAGSIDIFSDQPNTRLFRIIHGQVFYRLHSKIVTVFEQGDLLGLPRTLGLDDGVFSCDEPIELECYERDALLTHVNNDPKLQKNWAHYLLCQQAFYQQALAQEIRAEFQPHAGFMVFSKGDTIITQGDIADKVYTLLEGSAAAICDGMKVGEINENEIFGALAVFTRQPRMASVVATSDCTVLAVRKEEFVALIDHQPQICLGLIEEMAAKINQLNTQLLSRQ